MEDVVFDCAALTERCKDCGGPMDWEGDWYGCARCRAAKWAKEPWPADWIQKQFPEVAVDYSKEVKS